MLDTKINTSETTEIIGIADNKTLRSLGVIKLFLNFSDRLLPHNFHVLYENMYLRPDGIIGADFLMKYNGIIDIPQKTITLSQPESFYKLLKKKIKHRNSFQVKSKINEKTNKIGYNIILENYVNCRWRSVHKTSR